MKQPTADEMLDWLESEALQRGGLLLHDGLASAGRAGLGLTGTGRTLRQAVAQAMGYPRAGLPAERQCCGTFEGSRHRANCPTKVRPNVAGNRLARQGQSG